METCFLLSALSVNRYRAKGFSLKDREGEGRGREEESRQEWMLREEINTVAAVMKPVITQACMYTVDRQTQYVSMR